MKKMMVYLPDAVHEGLRQLAFEHRTSIAELIRRAVDAAYGEILQDIRNAKVRLAPAGPCRVDGHRPYNCLVS